MARVIRLSPGGSSTVEKIGLSLDQAKELAALFAAGRAADQGLQCFNALL